MSPCPCCGKPMICPECDTPRKPSYQTDPIRSYPFIRRVLDSHLPCGRFEILEEATIDGVVALLDKRRNRIGSFVWVGVSAAELLKRIRAWGEGEAA